jgi:hypothetical protein
MLSAPKVFEKARHDGAQLDDNYRRYVAETEEKIRDSRPTI